jgi:HD superfamily phosphohydrolase
MRCLFPSARHDRFIHSLGVYHLSRSVSQAINQREEEKYDKLLVNFQIAALLHDVGHSPFSHTLEDNFNKTVLEDHISKLIKSNSWSADSMSDIKKAGAAEHELMSVIVILEKYKNHIKSLFREMEYTFRPDFEFISRAILGAQYQNKIDDIVTRNGLIRLLNSKAIDIDKLDFITRDSQMAGYDNTNIDIQRLLRSLVIERIGDSGYITFTKGALSVIENVVVARNALYSWIYGHPRVIYEAKLIKDAVRTILHEKKSSKDRRRLLELFTVRGITDDLFCDDDVWCILKNRIDNINQCSELIDRGKQLTPIWESPTEFSVLFSNSAHRKVGDFDTETLVAILAGDNQNELDGVLTFMAKYSNKLSKKNSFQVIKSAPKMATLDADNIYVSIGKDVYPFNQLNPIASIKNKVVPYLYCSREDKAILTDAKGGIRSFCDYIKTYPGFALRDKIS